MQTNNINKILIIGGEGYIGSVLCKVLLNDNANVISYDNLIYNNHFKINEKMGYDNYRFINGDICDNKKLDLLIRESNAVILLAGLVGDPISKKYPDESALINDIGIRNVIDLCSIHNIKKFIFISTCSNYGLIENNDLAHEKYKLNPLSLYAKSKVNAEKYILSLKGKTNMNPTILRFATAFGLSSRMRFDLTINEFAYTMSIGKELLIYDANTWRPYCHVQDFVKLIRIVLNASNDKVSFEVFNAGSTKNNATKEMIVDLLLKKLPKSKINYCKSGIDPRNYKVDFQKVKSILGFESNYSIEDGIDEILNEIDKGTFLDVEKNKNLYGNYIINYQKPK
tara:strand:- start:245 stop:1264 length:1020 start_codon:yes stop_codon:yes gene_type:complete